MKYLHLALTAMILTAPLPALSDAVPQCREARGLVRDIHRCVPDCYWRVAQDCPVDTASPLTMRVLTGNSMAIGVFIPAPAIWVMGGMAPANRLHTSVHEYGHFVWFELLTDRERDTYEIVWKFLKLEGQLPSDYAGTNVIEGFAESFAEVYRPGRIRGGTEAERAFMCVVEDRLNPLRCKSSPSVTGLLFPTLGYRPWA